MAFIKQDRDIKKVKDGSSYKIIKSISKVSRQDNAPDTTRGNVNVCV